MTLTILWEIILSVWVNFSVKNKGLSSLDFWPQEISISVASTLRYLDDIVASDKYL